LALSSRVSLNGLDQAESKGHQTHHPKKGKNSRFHIYLNKHKNNYSTKMNILSKIKEVLASYKFEMLELMDGGMIETDSETLEVGSMVLVDTPDGKMPGPEGEHTLKDGRTIVLDAEGKVLEIKESDAPVAEEMDEEAADQVGEVREEIVEEAKDAIDEATPADVTPEDAQAIAEEIVSIVEDKVAEATMDMKKKMDEMSSILIEMAKSQEEFSKNFEEFKKAPSEKSISQTAFAAEGPVDLMSARIEAIKALRNNN